MSDCLRLPRVLPWFFLALVLVYFSLLGATRLFAHDPFEMTANGRLFPDKLVLTVGMSRSSGYALIEPGSPVGRTFRPEAFPQLLDSFIAHAPEIMEVKDGDTPLELKNSSVALTSEQDLEFVLEYAAPKHSPLHFRASQVKKLGSGYAVTVVVLTDKNQFLGSKLLIDDDPVFDLPLSGIAVGNTNASSASSSSSASDAPIAIKPSFSFRSYLRLGIEHILTGYDHLLFLGALLVVCRSLRGFLVIITCFTLAHSLTLGLAALDIVTLPSRIVEPLIAASIVYVAVENLLRRGQEPKGRGWLTFSFGLIHGFGFASALKETGLGRDLASLILPLFTFNLGVEMGQMFVAAVCLPLWWQLRKIKAVERDGAMAVSVAVACAGLYWLLERTVL